MTPDNSGPEMASALDDERLQFFLQNRDLILVWAALGDEVSDAVGDELRRLGGLVQDTATEASVQPAVADHVTGDSWRAPMLHRSSWMTSGADGPDIAIGIGWDGRKVQPTRGPGVSLPYVGVLASHDTARGRDIEAAVRPLAQRELVTPKAYRKGSHWIVYRSIEAPDDWYADLPGWRASVVEELIRTWDDCVQVIDQAVAGLT